MIEIYHNPRCRKSREALAYIHEKGLKVEEILYLAEPPTVKEFKLLLAKLNLGPQDLIRKNETLFKEKFKGKSFNDDEWIRILLEHPKLIERPIVIKGNKAVVGRPLEKVEELVG
jgi:arsenate reductase (glutaredoxin)